MKKKQDKSMLLVEFAKTFAESCRKIAELNKVYTAFGAGKITYQEFCERRLKILEEQSG